jgi:hypothetical protein
MSMKDVNPLTPNKSLEFVGALHVERVSQRQGQDSLSRQL